MARSARAFILCLGVMCAGCTSFQTVDVNPDRLREEIRAGNVVQVGDRVRVTLVSGETHTFRVTAVSATALAGQRIEVPVESIATLQTRDFSGTKTGALVGGITVVHILIAMMLSSLTFMM